MTIKQQLMDDMKTAMKAKEMVRLGAIRFLRAEIQKFEIDNGEQDDAGVLKLISKQVKQMRDAMAEYAKGDRNDLVEAEQAKVDVLEKYLPEQMSDDELKKIVAEVVAAQPDAKMGVIMGQVMAKVGGTADGGRVSAAVRELL